MKRTLIRGLLFLCLAAIVLCLVNTYYYGDQLSPYWGDKYIIGKKNYLLIKSKSRYNTVFIGSSKTHYQINPAQFDSTVNASSGQDSIHTYNFGIDGMLPPESFYICRQLLQEDRLKIKNLVIELQFLKDIEPHGFLTWRNIYWINPDTYSDYLSGTMKSSFSSKYKYRNLALLNMMYFKKLFHPTKFNIVNYYEVKRMDIDSMADHAGFEPLENDQTFMSYDSTKISNMAAYSDEAFANYDKWSALPQNEAYAKQIHDLADLAKEKGIRVFYFFPTQWSLQQYREMFPVLHNLPANSVLMMAAAKGHEPLFQPKNLYDSDHTNGLGARIFTKYIAQEFLDLYGVKSKQKQ